MRPDNGTERSRRLQLPSGRCPAAAAHTALPASLSAVRQQLVDAHVHEGALAHTVLQPLLRGLRLVVHSPQVCRAHIGSSSSWKQWKSGFHSPALGQGATEAAALEASLTTTGKQQAGMLAARSQKAFSGMHLHTTICRTACISEQAPTLQYAQEVAGLQHAGGVTRRAAQAGQHRLIQAGLPQLAPRPPPAALTLHV